MDENKDIVWNADAPVITDPNDDPEEFFIDSKGQKIAVKCRNCAMWQRNLSAYGDAPMCLPGRKISTTVVDQEITRRMNEDLWSCRLYFIPQESAGLLDLLPCSKEQLWALPRITQIVKAISRFIVEVQNKEAKEDLVTYAVEIAKEHLTKRTSAYTLPLLDAIAVVTKGKFRTERKPKRARNVRFHPGDQLEWTDLKTGQRMTGWFQFIGKRDSSIALLVQSEVAQALGYTSAVVKYSLEDWRSKSNPKLLNKATIVDVTT